MSRNTEIEHKWLVNESLVPDDLNVTDEIHIIQGYDAKTGLRYRRIHNPRLNEIAYFETKKTGSGLVRTEVERELIKSEFDTHWRKTEGRRITKTRYVIQDGRFTIELDRFESFRLLLVEVEFTSVAEANAYTPPAWFGERVTDNPRYSNAELSKNGA
jgi:adenylate cyclase